MYEETSGWIYCEYRGLMQSLRTKDKDEAAEKAKALVAKSIAGERDEVSAAEPPPPPTLGRVLDLYLREHAARHLGRSTRRAAEDAARRLVHYFGPVQHNAHACKKTASRISLGQSV